MNLLEEFFSVSLFCDSNDLLLRCYSLLISFAAA